MKNNFRDLRSFKFIEASNAIEGLYHTPTEEEQIEFKRFAELDKVTIKDLKKFVSVNAPGHRFRSAKGLNVSVGNHLAPLGGQAMYYKLDEILDRLETDSPYMTHVKYELLHPFTDGNGRSGRALWFWQMARQDKDKHWAERGFLHTFYYQALNYARN